MRVNRVVAIVFFALGCQGAVSDPDGGVPPGRADGGVANLDAGGTLDASITLGSSDAGATELRDAGPQRVAVFVAK